MIDQWFWRIPWGVINPASQAHGIDPFLTASIVLAESNGECMAMRYEPGFYSKYLREDKIKPEHQANVLDVCSVLNADYRTELEGRATSWGLMQVMGQVAREYGFKEWFPLLCANPALGLEYGLIHLKSKIKKYGDIKQAISAYNGGVPNLENFKSQKYVDKIMGYYQKLHQL